jgi:hypothetical protein
LTDGSCFNPYLSKEREKGFCFYLSNDSLYNQHNHFLETEGQQLKAVLQKGGISA